MQQISESIEISGTKDVDLRQMREELESLKDRLE